MLDVMKVVIEIGGQRYGLVPLLSEGWTPIENVEGLSARQIDSLKGTGIDYLEQLAQHTKGDILRIPYLSSGKAFVTLQERLWRIGLDMGQFAR